MTHAPPLPMGPAKSRRVARTVFRLVVLLELMAKSVKGGGEREPAVPDPHTSDVWTLADARDRDELVKRVMDVKYREVSSPKAKKEARHRPGRDGTEYRYYPGTNSIRGIRAKRLYPVEP